MANAKSAKPFHFSRFGNTGLEFDPLAVEVSILDRGGHEIWKKKRGESLEAIRWVGVNASGESVETGDYICKIAYPDNKLTYLPFVFMKRT